MIVGIGTDLVDVGRIRASLRRFGDRFLARVFTEQEAAYCLMFSDPCPHLAARFAAKEAVAKALGSGLSEGVRLRDIEIAHNAGGAALIRLHGAASDLAKTRGINAWHLSMSHTDLAAQACVIAER